VSGCFRRACGRPCRPAARVTEGGNPAGQPDGVTFLRMEAGAALTLCGKPKSLPERRPDVKGNMAGPRFEPATLGL
jgi:hypothetical protein